MEDLKLVGNTYKGGFFKNRHRLSWRAPVVAEALITTFDLKPGNLVMDVGCAIGDYVKELNLNGMYAWGIEGSEAAKEFFVDPNITVFDLRTPWNDGIIYDLAFSLEVAEHIEPEFVRVYCDNLCAISDTILISAASPGQKGHGHHNCQPREYWVELFNERGYDDSMQIEQLWRNMLQPWCTKKELSSYIRNAIIFKRRTI